MTNDERPIQIGVFNSSTGAVDTRTVPDGEVWTVLGLMGNFQGGGSLDYMAVIVNNGTFAVDVFTFNVSTIGNNSFNLIVNIVLDAGHTLSLASTSGVTDCNLVASGVARTIY